MLPEDVPQQHADAPPSGGGSSANREGATPTGPDDLVLPGLRRRTAVADCVIIILYLAVADEICAQWCSTYWATGRTADLATAWQIAGAVTGAAVPVLAALLTKRSHLPPGAVGLRREGVESQVLWGLLGAVIACVAVSLWQGAEWLVDQALRQAGTRAPWSWSAAEEYAQSLTVVSTGTFIGSTAVTVVAEETAFRGMILPRLRRLTGRWWIAVVACSALFGMMHWAGGLVYILSAAVMSVIFCVVFIRTRSLLAACVAHFAYNVAQYVLARVQYGG